MHKLRRTRERQTVLPDCRIVRGHGYVPVSRVRMALSSIAGGPRATRRRFLGGAGSAAMGVPLSLALTRIAAAQTQAPGQTQTRIARRVIPSTAELLPVIGCGTWRTFDVDNDRAARAQLAEVLRILFEAGGSVVDSSPMYGSSEAVAGALLTQLDAHAKAFVATKVWTQGRD